jgi:hypothetical protein
MFTLMFNKGFWNLSPCHVSENGMPWNVMDAYDLVSDRCGLQKDRDLLFGNEVIDFFLMFVTFHLVISSQVKLNFI